MNTQTFNNLGNETIMDFDEDPIIYLEKLMDRVELEDWLAQVDNEMELDELELVNDAYVSTHSDCYSDYECTG